MPPPPPSELVQRAYGLLNSGQPDKAEETLRRAIQKNAKDPYANHLLGLVLFQAGKREQAEYFIRAAVRADPARPEFRSGLGNMLAMTNRHAEAIEAFREALKIDPAHTAAHVGLALSLTRSADLDGAIAAGREACRLQPGLFQPWVNLSSTLVQAGRADEAIDTLRDAAGRFPASVPVHTALLTALNYVPGVSADEIADHCRKAGALMGTDRKPAFANTREPDRRLRVAIVSGDLRTHSVAFFAEPILEARDRAAMEILCYSTARGGDATTERLKALSDGWVEAAELNDDALLKRFESDRIDIIVELSGHTNGNRLAALARRGAPVQATYLGYPNTTGVPAIDYRIVDALTDPPGAERLATEKLVRLPGCFLCYRPFTSPAPPEPGPPPSASAGHVTFGSFNSMPKIGQPTIDLWTAILKDVPGSRLLLKNKSLADPNARRRLVGQFAGRGIDESRLELFPPAPTQSEHLAVYERMDIGLDTFPYHGTTTTCEALWMGVPVVTLEGDAHASRVGVSLLTNTGLTDLIARSPEEYRRLAAGLAGDPARLADLRRTLRARVGSSTLCDAPGFAKKFQAALRGMWREWCSAG